MLLGNNRKLKTYPNVLGRDSLPFLRNSCQNFALVFEALIHTNMIALRENMF